MEREFPGFRIVPKRESPLSKVIDAALRIVTLGGQRAYMTHYHTVLGSTLYTPESWEGTPDMDRLITLRHERVHLRQRRRLSFPLMAFVYMVPFFPVGLAYGRARLEWEAYEETLAATAELRGLDALRSRGLREHIVRRFTGAEIRAEPDAALSVIISDLQRQRSARVIMPGLHRVDAMPV